MCPHTAMYVSAILLSISRAHLAYILRIGRRSCPSFSNIKHIPLSFCICIPRSSRIYSNLQALVPELSKYGCTPEVVAAVETLAPYALSLPHGPCFPVPPPAPHQKKIWKKPLVLRRSFCEGKRTIPLRFCVLSLIFFFPRHHTAADVSGG